MSSEADLLQKHKKSRGVHDIVKQAIETLNLSKDLEQQMGLAKKKEAKIALKETKSVENQFTLQTEKRKEAYQERLKKAYQGNLDEEEVCLI